LTTQLVMKSKIPEMLVAFGIGSAEVEDRHMRLLPYAQGKAGRRRWGTRTSLIRSISALSKLEQIDVAVVFPESVEICLSTSGRYCETSALNRRTMKRACVTAVANCARTIQIQT
jgi:hypothetical protein